MGMNGVAPPLPQETAVIPTRSVQKRGAEMDSSNSINWIVQTLLKIRIDLK